MTDQARRDPQLPEETGRDPAPSFRREPHPTSYGRPDRARLKRALQAYIAGHDRGWEAERKLREADRDVERAAADRFREPPAEDAAHPPGERAAGSGGMPESTRTARSRASVRATAYGVSVPERLVFHRGPDTWRDRLRRREGSARAERVFRRDATEPETE